MAWKTAPGGGESCLCNPVSETLGSNGHEPQPRWFTGSRSLPATGEAGNKRAGAGAAQTAAAGDKRAAPPRRDLSNQEI